MKRLAPSDAPRFPLLFALALLTVLAGCATAPTEPTTTPGTETFEVELTGNSSATYLVQAELVPEPFENVTVTYANGSTRSIPVPERQSAVTYGPESEVTNVESGRGTVGGVHFQGTPNFSVTANDVPRTGNAVYTVQKQGEEVLVAWGLIRCDGHVTGVSLRADESRTAGGENESETAGSENESGIAGVAFGCES